MKHVFLGLLFAATGCFQVDDLDGCSGVVSRMAYGDCPHCNATSEICGISGRTYKDALSPRASVDNEISGGFGHSYKVSRLLEIFPGYKFGGEQEPDAVFLTNVDTITFPSRYCDSVRHLVWWHDGEGQVSGQRVFQSAVTMTNLVSLKIDITSYLYTEFDLHTLSQVAKIESLSIVYNGGGCVFENADQLANLKKLRRLRLGGDGDVFKVVNGDGGCNVLKRVSGLDLEILDLSGTMLVDHTSLSGIRVRDLITPVVFSFDALPDELEYLDCSSSFFPMMSVEALPNLNKLKTIVVDKEFFALINEFVKTKTLEEWGSTIKLEIQNSYPKPVVR